MLTPKATLRRVKFLRYLTVAYISKYKLRIVGLIVIILISGLLFIKIKPLITRSNLVTIGYVGNYRIENLPADVLSLATGSLIKTDSIGKPIASLASNWTVSDDQKTYIVYLRDNLKWHDSTTVVASNISIAIKNVEINAPNNKTIEFKLPNPISSFPQTLDKPIFKINSFYGTGQYRMVKIDSLDGIVKKLSLRPQNHEFPKVEIKFYSAEEQLIEAIKIGEVKKASVIDSSKLSNWQNLIINKNMDNTQIITIFLNNDDGFLSNRDVRQALAYAIDRSKFEGQETSGPIASTSWAYNDSIKRYEFNLSKAKELIAKPQTKDLKITLSTTADLASVAAKIKNDWQALGVEVQVKEEKSVPANFQALLAIDKLSPDPDQYALWHSTQKETNITRYKNVKIDKLLEDARNTIDDKTRLSLYHDFQKFLAEDEPAIFLYVPYKYTVTYKNIENLLTKLPKN